METKMERRKRRRRRSKDEAEVRRRGGPGEGETGAEWIRQLGGEGSISHEN